MEISPPSVIPCLPGREEPDGGGGAHGEGELCGQQDVQAAGQSRQDDPSFLMMMTVAQANTDGSCPPSPVVVWKMRTPEKQPLVRREPPEEVSLCPHPLHSLTDHLGQSQGEEGGRLPAEQPDKGAF